MGMNFNDPFAHGAYLLWDGGALKFDIISQETIERDAAITEHPVEVGVDISDHYRVKLRSIKLEAFVSQEPTDPTLYPGMTGSIQAVELALPMYPAAALAQALAFDIAALAFGAVQRAIPVVPPTRFTQQALVYPNPIDTVAYVENTLDDLRANATLVDVATTHMYFAQHLLGAITMKKDEKTGAGATFSLELRQVVFVSTQSVAAPPQPVKKKDTPLTDKGKQNPVPAANESFAVSLGKLAGLLNH